MVRALAGLVAVCLLSAPSAAFAHGGLKSSLPASGATVHSAPKEIRLVFTEAVELAFTRVELRGPQGAVRLASPSFAGSDRLTIFASIDAPLVAGNYTVTWQIAGADGHPVRGTYKFTIAADAIGLTPTTPTDSDTIGAASTQVHHDPAVFPAAGRFDAESPLYVAIRWLQFASILVLTGAVAFYVFVLGLLRRAHPAGSPLITDASRGAASIGLYAAIALAAVVVMRLFAQSYAMHAPESGFAPALMWAMIGGTTWGWGWLLQLVAAVGAIIGFSAAGRSLNRGWLIATLSVVLGAFAPALSGHAASAPMLRPLAILSDGIHILGASGWLGSLFVVLAAGIPVAMRLETDARTAAVADLFNAFSPTALVFAGITAASGVFAAWLHLGTIPALWQTQYGKTLLIKLAVLGIVTATGAYNFLYVKPRLARPEGAIHIRRSATVEVAVAAGVLLVTAILVATPTAMDMTE